MELIEHLLGTGLMVTHKEEEMSLQVVDAQTGLNERRRCASGALRRKSAKNRDALSANVRRREENNLTAVRRLGTTASSTAPEWLVPCASSRPHRSRTILLPLRASPRAALVSQGMPAAPAAKTPVLDTEVEEATVS